LHRFEVSQIVIGAVQNVRRDVPLDGIFSHVAKVFPRKRLTKVRRNFTFFAEFIFGDVSPLHHIANELFQVHHRRNEERLLDAFFTQSVHREKRADAIRDKHDFVVICGNRVKIRREFLFGIPRGFRPEIKTDDIAVREKGFVVICFVGVAAFPMYVNYELFHCFRIENKKIYTNRLEIGIHFIKPSNCSLVTRFSTENAVILQPKSIIEAPT